MTLKQALFIQMSSMLLNMLENDEDFQCNVTYEGDHDELETRSVKWFVEKNLVKNMNNYVAEKAKVYLSTYESLAKEWGLDLDEDLDAGNTAAATQMFDYIMKGGDNEN